jgi:hypothetical protein
LLRGTAHRFAQGNAMHHHRHFASAALRSPPLLLWLGVGALLAGSWRRLQDTHRRRLQARPTPLPERLQAWEGEGGRPVEKD